MRDNLYIPDENIQKGGKHFSKANLTEFFSWKFLQQKNEIFHFEYWFPDAAKKALSYVHGGYIGAALD
mgnify:CR=1 FL=1